MVPDVAGRRQEERRPWAMTREAWTHLIDEITGLRQEIASLTTQGLEEGIVRLPVALAARRLDTLEGVLGRAQVVDGESSCVIGRRATLREESGASMSYAVVFPGDGNTDDGCISADSPLGRAILGARPGDVVHVDAPAGRWSVTLVSVD